MPKIEPFEKYSSAYDMWFEKNRKKYEAELEVIRQLISNPKLKGLEVGVGSGKFAAPLGIKIGIEPSKKMAIKAKKKHIKVYKGVAEKLPFSNNSFDFVLMVTTICFVDDILKTFKEVYRVLKPRGYIVVGFVDKESELGKKYLKEKEKSRFYKEATFFSTQEVLKYLKDAGFKPTEIKQTLIPTKPAKIVLSGFGKGSFVAIKAVK